MFESCDFCEEMEHKQEGLKENTAVNRCFVATGVVLLSCLLHAAVCIKRSVIL